MGMGGSSRSVVLRLQHKCAPWDWLHPILFNVWKAGSPPNNIDLAFGLPPHSDTSHNDYAASLRCTLQEAYESVRKDLGHHLRRQKELYDKKAHGQPYKKGDLVWLHNAAVTKGKFKNSINHGLVLTGW